MARRQVPRRARQRVPAKEAGGPGQQDAGPVEAVGGCGGIRLLRQELVEPVQGHVHGQLEVDGALIGPLQLQHQGHAHQRVSPLIVKAQRGVDPARRAAHREGCGRDHRIRRRRARVRICIVRHRGQRPQVGLARDGVQRDPLHLHQKGGHAIGGQHRAQLRGERGGHPVGAGPEAPAVGVGARLRSIRGEIEDQGLPPRADLGYPGHGLREVEALAHGARQLARLDGEAAQLEHVGDAPHDVQRAVLVQPGPVAGVVEAHVPPAHGQGAEPQARLLGAVHVSGPQHAGPFEMQLSGHAGRAERVRLVQDHGAQVLHRHAHRGGPPARGRGQPRHAHVMRLADAVEVPQRGPRHLVQRCGDQVVADDLAVQDDAAQRQGRGGLAVQRAKEGVVEGGGEQHLVDVVPEQEIGQPAGGHQRAGIREP